jgi:DNA methylase
MSKVPISVSKVQARFCDRRAQDLLRNAEVAAIEVDDPLALKPGEKIVTMEHLGMHPTVKPVALIADAMRDCTTKGDIVLDCFAGSGSTLMAAEKVGRRGRGVEHPVSSVGLRRTTASRHERTSAVVPKNIPESLTLGMLYPAFSHERHEDIGPFG